MSEINIRTATPDDAPTLVDIYAYYVENTLVSFEYAAPSVEEFRSRIEKTLTRYPYLVAELDGTVVGYCYAGGFHTREAYSHSAELSIYVRRDCRRMGIGRALLTELEKRLERQNVLNLYAGVAFPVGGADTERLTLASFEFHKRMGYEPVAMHHMCGFKLGEWANLAYLEKHIGKHTEQPAPFIPAPQLDGQY